MFYAKYSSEIEASGKAKWYVLNTPKLRAGILDRKNRLNRNRHAVVDSRGREVLRCC